MGNIYLENKFVESIIYDQSIDEKLKKQAVDQNLEKKFDINFLKYLNQYLKLAKREKTMDMRVKERLHKIIRYIRFNLGQNGNQEYNEELNKAIIILNQMPTDNYLNFYYNQMNARAHDSKTSTMDEKMEKIFELYDDLCYSICHDYEVICDLMKEPKEYIKTITKYTGEKYGLFLCSVKGIYYEYPELFEENNIKDNLRITIIQGSISGLNKMLKQSTKEVQANILNNNAKKR